MKKFIAVVFAVALICLLACPSWAVVKEVKGAGAEGAVVVQSEGAINVVSPQCDINGYCRMGPAGMHKGWSHGGCCGSIILRILCGLLFLCVTSFIFSVIFWLTYKWIVVGKKPAAPVKIAKKK